MPRMKLLVSVAGEDGWYPGQVVDVDEDTARRWCDGERAEMVSPADGKEPNVTDEKSQADADSTDQAKPAKPVRRGRRPAGEQATAPPAGEQR